MFLIGLLFFLTSCSSSEDDTGNVILSSTPFKTGNFVSGAHPTSGSVSVSPAKKTLSFKNFKTDNGPLLVVYLSTSVGSVDFVSLGDLKGIEGDYSYNIPANTDFSKYTFVDIWCIAASVSFGHAELE